MLCLLYFFMAVCATTIGSFTGMGGGIIMKPLMDLLHNFDVETIGVLSSVTVFFMSVVSIGKQMYARSYIPFSIAIPLSIGSVVGGYVGQQILYMIISTLRIQERVIVVQNFALAILILCVYFYMRNKTKISSHRLSGIAVTLTVGCFLGICSSFLGIGGGPINVALVIYLYSMDIKSATVCSLMTILFAQISKLGTIALSTGFMVYDLSVAPAMVVGAIIGGFIGAGLNKRCPEKSVERVFNWVQLLVLTITIYNMAQNLVRV